MPGTLPTPLSTPLLTPSATSAAAPAAGAGGPVTAGALLDLVRRRQATTRRDLMRWTGLSRTAVTVRVGALLEAGLLVTGEEEATGGRPAEGLSLNPGAGCVLAVAVGRSRSQLGLFDLRGRELVSESTEHEGAPLDLPSPAQLLPRLVTQTATLLERVEAPLLGVGMSVPGSVDPVAGAVRESPVLAGWDGVPLAPYLAPLGDVPLVLGNDADVLASAELLAQGAALRDALVVKASTGLGLGLVVEGRVVRGHTGAAGEIGHVRVPEAEGLVCRCGATGCLETLAAGWALVAQVPADLDVTHVRRLVHRARHGDATARALLRTGGQHLGTALAATANVLNPAAIVLGGDMAGVFDLYAAGVRETLYPRLTSLAARDLQLVPAHHGDHAGLVGCAALALDALLAPAQVDHRLSAAGTAARTVPA